MAHNNTIAYAVSMGVKDQFLKNKVKNLQEGINYFNYIKPLNKKNEQQPSNCFFRISEQ